MNMCVRACVCVCMYTHTLRATKAEARWGEVGKTYPQPIPSLGGGTCVGWNGLSREENVSHPNSSP